MNPAGCAGSTATDWAFRPLSEAPACDASLTAFGVVAGVVVSLRFAAALKLLVLWNRRRTARRERDRTRARAAGRDAPGTPSKSRASSSRASAYPVLAAIGLVTACMSLIAFAALLSAALTIVLAAIAVHIIIQNRRPQGRTEEV